MRITHNYKRHVVGNECINNRKGLMYKNRGREREERERGRERERGGERERERGGVGDKERTDRQELHITGLFTILWLQ